MKTQTLLILLAALPACGGSYAATPCDPDVHADCARSYEHALDLGCPPGGPGWIENVCVPSIEFVQRECIQGTGFCSKIQMCIEAP